MYENYKIYRQFYITTQINPGARIQQKLIAIMSDTIIMTTIVFHVGIVHGGREHTSG